MCSWASDPPRNKATMAASGTAFLELCARLELPWAVQAECGSMIGPFCPGCVCVCGLFFSRAAHVRQCDSFLLEHGIEAHFGLAGRNMASCGGLSCAATGSLGFFVQPDCSPISTGQIVS